MWLGVSLQCSGWCWPDETVCTHKNVLARQRRLLDSRDGTRVFAVILVVFFQFTLFLSIKIIKYSLLKVCVRIC